MKITRIFACRAELPLRATTPQWSGGKSVTVFGSTILRVETVEQCGRRIRGHRGSARIGWRRSGVWKSSSSTEAILGLC